MNNEASNKQVFTTRRDAMRNEDAIVGVTVPV
jgi:hypothetical protein